MSAVLGALQQAGIQTQENSQSSDAAVIWSVLWNGRMKANQTVYEHYRAQGKPVIIIEIGALHRGITWKIAVNNITAQGYYGHLDRLDWDRPARLKVSLAKPATQKSNIVIAAQHDRSLQVSNIVVSDWVKHTVTTLKKHTDRPIAIRPHPRCRLLLNNLPPGVSIETPRKLNNTYDSYDMHYDCHAVVNYNSGPGTQAAIAGVRALVDQTSLAWPVSIDLTELEQPYSKDRDLWLTQICHTEYTLDELKAGLWLKRIESALTP